MRKPKKDGSTKPVVRLDRFILPYTAYTEFTNKLREIHSSLRKQEGFISDLLLEQPVSIDTIYIVTVVGWASTEAAETAKFNLSKEFDRDDIISRLRIIADIGLFSLIEN